MSIVIDFHTHVFPNYLEEYLDKHLPPAGTVIVNRVRKQVRGWIRPFTNSVQKARPLVRYLPDGARVPFDLLGSVASVPSLFVEATAPDLEQAMGLAGIDAAVIIAHPPLISNDLVLDLAAEAKLDSPRFIPAVYIPKKAKRPSALLRSYVKKGAKLLKIHPAADGEGPKSAQYKTILRTAADLDLPVILHTGTGHSPLMFREPELGRVELFSSWFKAYPKLKFILAHMNEHAPQLALDLAVRHPNVYVDTASQPAEIIGEAARRIGTERVLFASDWPMVGNNLSIARNRIRDCVSIGLINEGQENLILGENAAGLLKLRLKSPLDTEPSKTHAP